MSCEKHVKNTISFQIGFQRYAQPVAWSNSSWHQLLHSKPPQNHEVRAKVWTVHVWDPIVCHELLWMEEILHQLIGGLSHYLTICIYLYLFVGFQPSRVVQDFFHPPYVPWSAWIWSARRIWCWCPALFRVPLRRRGSWSAVSFSGLFCGANGDVFRMSPESHIVEWCWMLGPLFCNSQAPVGMPVLVRLDWSHQNSRVTPRRLCSDMGWLWVFLFLFTIPMLLEAQWSSWRACKVPLIFGQDGAITGFYVALVCFGTATCFFACKTHLGEI